MFDSVFREGRCRQALQLGQGPAEPVGTPQSRGHPPTPPVSPWPDRPPQHLTFKGDPKEFLLVWTAPGRLLSDRRGKQVPLMSCVMAQAGILKTDRSEEKGKERFGCRR